MTRGRRTGREHAVTLWFAYDDGVLWLRTDLTRRGTEPDWYRNLVHHRECRIVVDGLRAEGRLEESIDREADLRHLVRLWREKYGAMWVQDWYVDQGRIPVKVRVCAA